MNWYQFCVTTGTFVAVSINGLHNNPHLWEDAATFDPERFSPERAKDIPPYAYVPFSAGPRWAVRVSKLRCEVVFSPVARDVFSHLGSCPANKLVIIEEKRWHACADCIEWSQEVGVLIKCYERLFCFLGGAWMWSLGFNDIKYRTSKVGSLENQAYPHRCVHWKGSVLSKSEDDISTWSPSRGPI